MFLRKAGWHGQIYLSVRLTRINEFIHATRQKIGHIHAPGLDIALKNASPLQRAKV